MISNTKNKVNRVVKLLDSLNDSDRIAVLEALHDETIDSKSIFKILNKNGWEISYDQVRRFRNGSCRVPDRYKKD